MLKRYRSAFFTPIIVLAVFAVFFALNGFFPFGKSSVSWCDMTQQVIPLLCDFKDILLGEEGFFLSLQNSGGMNFLGVFFFFLASPFSFLVAFVEKADIPLLMNIIFVLKLCVCAFCAAVYFEKRFQRLSLPFKMILSLSYAFCGYAMMFYQNIIWLDIMYLFPILMLGIHSLTEKGKPWVLIFALTATVIVNFYISYMVILFLLLYFGVYAFYFKSKDYILYVRLGVSVVISLALSAVVWVPSFMQYSSSGRKSGVLQGLMYCDFLTATETCVPVLLATSVIFACLLVLLPTLESRAKEVKMSVFVFLAMCVPIFIEPVNRMWHTGNYMSFPVRYGFITVFLGLIVCAQLLVSLEAQKGNNVVNVFAAISGILSGVFAVWYTSEHLETISRYAQTLWGNRESYHQIIVLFLSFVFVGTICILLAKNKLVSKKILAVVLGIIVVFESYSSLMIYVTPSADSLDMDKYTEFCELEEAIDDNGFYRVNMSEKLIDANMTGAIGYNSLGHYTSLTDSKYMDAIKALGYSGYWMEIGNWGGNVISDALMAVKYRINETTAGFEIKENPLSLGLTIPLDSQLPKDIPTGDRAIVAGNIFKDMFSLENSPVTRYEITDMSYCDYSQSMGNHILNELGSNNYIVYDVYVKGQQTLYFDCFNGGSNSLDEPINNAFSVYVNGKAVSQSYPSQNKNGMLELGTFKDESVTVLLQLNKSVNCYSFGVFGFDITRIKQAVSDFTQAKVTVKGNTVKTEIPSDHKGEVFISLPYNEGYTVRLNGDKIAYKPSLTGFMSVNVSHGGELQISFIPPMFVVGLIISALGIVALLLLCIFRKRIDNISLTLKKSVFVLFVAVFAIFLIIIYVMPVVANLVS